MIVIFFLHSKKSLCFLHWILHSFLCLKPLSICCRYYMLELENIHFIFMGMFWFVLDLECMSDPCCFESFFAWGDSCFLLHADFFSVCRKDWFFISLSVSKRIFSFLSPLFYSQALLNDVIPVLCIIV